MSDKVFKLNLPGLNDLMKSEEMCAILTRGAEAIAGAAGEGFEVEPAHPISFVAIASVRAATKAARKAALQDNVLEVAAKGVRI